MAHTKSDFFLLYLTNQPLSTAELFRVFLISFVIYIITFKIILYLYVGNCSFSHAYRLHDQSSVIKMCALFFWQISRGSIFIFGIQMTVFGCKSPDFIGRDCNSSVTQLCTQEAASSHSNFFRNIHFNSREIRGNLNPPSAENDLEIKNEASNWVSGVDDASWRSLKLQRVAPGAWTYFSLEIADYFPAKLEIHAECTNSSSCGRTEEEEVAKLYLKFGRLPNEGDEFSVVSGSSLPVSVPAPRRGRWFIGVRGNSSLTTVLEFSLLWRVLSCPYGMAGENCTSTVKSLEVPEKNNRNRKNPTSQTTRGRNIHVQTINC